MMTSIVGFLGTFNYEPKLYHIAQKMKFSFTKEIFK